MNFKIYKRFLPICAILLATSCSVENIEPINQLTEDNVITNETTANAVLNRIYNAQRNFVVSSFSGAVGYYGIEQDVTFGIFGDQGFLTNNVLDNSRLVQDLYEAYYAIINDINFFVELLDGATGLDETVKNEMLAQARFFRAQSHFHLLRTFGEFFDSSSEFGVVVNLSPFRGAEDAAARLSVQATYDAIVDDLQFAVANGRSGVSHIFVSAVTAQALLAKVQLYMGDYAAAATNAMEVVNNTDGYALEGAFASIFNLRWESSEVLFAPFVDGLDERNTFVENTFGASAITPSTAFNAIADASDGAVDGVLDFFGAPESGFDPRFSYAYSLATRGFNGNGKYPFVSFSQNADAGNTYYYMRMAEVYLIHAEAEARRSGGDLNAALASLNAIRTRGGVPVKTLSDAATLLEDIRNEKMLELFAETGESYFDLVRYDQLGNLDASSFKASLTDDKFVFPIPAAALAGNDLLVPNPNQ